MPDLNAALRDQDIGFLRLIADFWGLRLSGADQPSMRREVVAHLRDANLLAEVVASLPEPALQALAELVQQTGRMPWSRFLHRHGEFRQMGIARRDRERPFRNPVSPVETLFYRSLIARAFLESPDGSQEFAYIPDDLLPLIPPLTPASEPPLGHPAADPDCAHVQPAADSLLDHATTLLAALRMGRDFAGQLPPGMLDFLRALLTAAEMLTPQGEPEVDALRSFLEAPRAEALADLTRTWLTSREVNDLLLVPALEAEGKWSNDPLGARTRIIDFLGTLPGGVWWSLPGFIAAVKEFQPEFQRPDGDFDSWYIKDRVTGAYLRGVEHWNSVEGSLIAWILTGPLHWLGVLDLANHVDDFSLDLSQARFPLSFRISRWGRRLLKGIPPSGLPKEEQPIHVRSDGRISAPRLAPRAARYLLARFCEWEPEVTDEYRYRATPSSLTRAADRGLRVNQLIGLLARYGVGIPPNVTTALKNWQNQGQAGRIETVPVLRLPSGEALNALQNSRGARYLGDVLGPAAVALRPGTEHRVIAVLAELGYLGEVDE